MQIDICKSVALININVIKRNNLFNFKIIIFTWLIILARKTFYYGNHWLVKCYPTYIGYAGVIRFPGNNFCLLFCEKKNTNSVEDLQSIYILGRHISRKSCTHKV